MRSTFQLLALMAVVVVSGCQCNNPVTVGDPCVVNTDCSDPAATLCQPNVQVCVECLDDSTCALGKICNPDGTCEDGCRSDHDRCENNGYCEAGVGTCAECLKDQNCPAGNVCSNKSCVPGCSAANTNCGPGLVCDLSKGKCVQCASNTDCKAPTPPVCNPATQTCVQCLSNTDCKDAAKPNCNTATNLCVRCVTDMNCPAGNVCKNAACVPGCSATQACAAGQVCKVSSGTCVQCTSDTQCSGATPRCDLNSNTCKPCLPGATDNCPMGQYCRSDFTCEQGCKVPTDCPSGQCLADHSCGSCTMDSQCAAGKTCQNGTCVAACSASNPCGAGRTCCTGKCVDFQNDPANCGACGTTCGTGQSCCNGTCSSLDTTAACGACGTTCATGQGCCNKSCIALNTLTNCGACGNACVANQFCDSVTCRNQTFPEFCANNNVYAIQDGQASDDAATSVLVSTIQQYCSMSISIQTGPQTNPQWVDQTTGALLLGGGSTVVTAGGPFPNKPVKWLERTQQITKVYFASNGVNTYYFRRRADNVDLVTRPDSFCQPGQDVFVVQLATDPTSGTLALITYGLCSGVGTRTGAWYWANVMLPNRTLFTDSWYLYEWVDTNGDLQPDLGDTFTQLSSGK